MTRTLHQIQLNAPGGGPVLLAIGDRVEEELAPDFAQPAARFGAIGARWGTGVPLGNVERKMEWTREKNYATNSAARLAMIAEPALVGGWDSNTADITIAGVPGCHGDMVFRVFDFSLEAMVPRAVVCGTGGRLLWKFSARGGEALPVSGVLEAPGYPVSWSLTDAQDQTWRMQDGYPAPTACTPTASTPSDPGDFEGVAFSPADPGDFEATAFSPTDPGDFTFSGFSPSDPGNGTNNVPGILVAGTLTPNAAGTYQQTSTDIHGLPVYTSANPFVTYPTIEIMWNDPLETGIGFWRMRYQTSVSAGSVWAASVQTTGSVPTPASATGWFPAASFGGAPTATGTPTFTAIP